MIAPTTYDPTTWEGFGDFTVTVALSPEDKATANDWLEKEHPLGEFRPIGHSLMHIIREDGQPVAAIQWAACAYHLKDREAWIGWNAQTCARRRNLIVNNVRFVIPEATRRPNLASKALAHAVRALPGHWHEHFGYEPLLCETFTDIESHEGTCYKAAGWTPLGLTEGNRRQRAEFYVPNKRPKKLWIKALRPDSRERLRAHQLDPAHAVGETVGKGAPLPITAAQLKPLAEALRSVPDPRRRNRQHPIGPMLSMIALGILCGGTNLNAIVRHARRLTQAQRCLLGARGTRTSPGSRQWIYHVPDYETFRRLLRAIDLDAFAQVLNTWLSAHRGALPAQLALDGKVVRDQLGTIITLCDTEQKTPVAIAATTAPGGEQACARKLLRSDEVTLHNATVSLDALYANGENARLIVQEKGGDYLISVKDNQPTLHQQLSKELEHPPFLPPPRSAATAPS
jgi:hypothetical protein